MTFLNEPNVRFSDSPSVDAFGRLRTGSARTIFAHKELNEKNTFLWSEATSGGAETSVFNASTSSVDMSVTTNGEYLIRQTKQCFNYQPGKSQLVLLTGVMNPETNIIKRIGLFISNITPPHLPDEGMYFSTVGDNVFVNKVKQGVVTSILQSSWNLDKMDGTGASGINLDFSKGQLFVIDYQWLGFGRLRMGFSVNGEIIYCHEFSAANILSEPFTSTPNLPIHYEIRSNGPSGTLQQNCSTVQTEGGPTARGILVATSTPASGPLDANMADTTYALISIRLKPNQLDAAVQPTKISILSESKDDIKWTLSCNATIDGPLTYSGINDSAVESALGTTANTVSDLGFIVDEGFTAANSETTVPFENDIMLGNTIDGIPDTFVISVTPLTPNAGIHGALQWVEQL
jgi:hypothetical protein